VGFLTVCIQFSNATKKEKVQDSMLFSTAEQKKQGLIFKIFPGMKNMKGKMNNKRSLCPKMIMINLNDNDLF
jgi:hypothetical protein